MEKRCFLMVALVAGLLSIFAFRISGQEDSTRLRVVVNLVQLNVAVTDNKGNYLTGLHPWDFVIAEHGIAENIATFEEENVPTTRFIDIAAETVTNCAGD